MADCAPKVLVSGAALPSVTGGDLYFVTGGRYRGDVDASDYAVERLNLTTGKRSVVRSAVIGTGAVPNGLAASAGHLIVTLDHSNGGLVEIVDVSAGKVIEFKRSSVDRFGYPEATDRFVAWADGNASPKSKFGGYLWDFKNEKLYSVGNQPGLYALAADGSRLVWQEGGKYGTNIRTVVGQLK